MAENSPEGGLGPDLEFLCPHCGETIEMTLTPRHNLKQLSEGHLPPSPDDTEIKGCPVFFGRYERSIREDYDFIQYELPIVFAAIPNRGLNSSIFSDCLDAIENQNLGLKVEVEVGGYLRDIFLWRYGYGPKYYAVAKDQFSPDNVHVSYSQKEVEQFVSDWL